MKILCVSDTIDRLVYSSGIKTRFADVDAVIGAGDLPLDYYDYIVSNLNKPLFFVFGNHNLKYFDHFRRKHQPLDEYHGEETDARLFPPGGGTHIGNKCIRAKVGGRDLIVAGLGGCMLYNKGPNQYTDLRMYLKVFVLVPRFLFNRIFRGRFLDILVTHAPPRGIHDLPDRCHTGFKAFVWLVRVFKPRFLIHGHVHLYSRNDPRVSEHLDTTIVNACDHHVIELDPAEAQP